MNYSQRIARILTSLQEKLSIGEYLDFIERVRSVDDFSSLSDDDQLLIVEIEVNLNNNINANVENNSESSNKEK